MRRLLPRRLRGALPALFLLAFACDSDSVSFTSSTSEALFAWPVLASPIARVGGVSFEPILDFNGDGRPDVAIVGTDGVLQIAIQTENGRFVASSPHLLAAEVGDNVTILAVGDLPGDELPDLLVGGTLRASILMNIGGGQFLPVTTLSGLPTHQSSYGSGDMNDDGRAEFLVVTSTGETQSITLDQTGRLVVTPLVTGFPFATPTSVDFNQDGRTDLALKLSYTTPVYLFRQTGAGEFEEQGPVGGLHINTFGDLDQDGDPDLVSLSCNGLGWNENRTGKFEPFVSFTHSLSPGYSPATVPSLGDLNGDGLMDVGSLGCGQAFFQVPSLKFVPAALPPVARQGQLTDINGDGRLDILAAGDGIIDVALQQSGGGFAQTPSYSQEGAFFVQMECAQLGSPPVPRVVLHGYDNSTFDAKLHILRVDQGQPVLDVIQNFPRPHVRPLIVALSDFTGDGIADLLAVGPLGLLVLYAGTATPGFAAAPHGLPIAVYGTVGVGDLDGDSDLDLVSALDHAIHLNDGSGHFTVAPGPNFDLYVNFHQSAHLYDVRDYDGDGRIDIVYRAPLADSPGLIAFGLGGSPPTFAPVMPMRPLIIPNSPRQWTFFDMDEDGAPDFLETEEGFWLRNLGTNLATGPRLPLPPSFRKASVHVADLDGDGADDDLFSYSHFSFSAWTREDPNALRLRHSSPDGPRYSPLLLFDFDSDGRSDLLSFSPLRLHCLVNTGRLQPR